MKTNKYLLLGGNGFLGKTIQEELNKRKISFVVRDIEDYDLTKDFSIFKLTNDLSNITHIFFLSSNVGIDKFNGSDAEKFAQQNYKMFENLCYAINLASYQYNKLYNIIYFSTSEIFGSNININCVIDDFSIPNIKNNNRGLYSKVKLTIEDRLISMKNLKTINDLYIVRPFNISGKYQRRGVVYDMIRTAFDKNIIEYRKDTTRTITYTDIFVKKLLDFIDNNKSGIFIKNIYDENGSVYLESLAMRIKDILETRFNFNDIKLIEHNPDSEIQYRHVTKPDKYIDVFHKTLNNIVSDIINDK